MLAKISCTVMQENLEQVKAQLLTRGVREITEATGMYPGMTDITFFAFNDVWNLDVLVGWLSLLEGVLSPIWRPVKLNQILS